MTSVCLDIFCLMCRCVVVSGVIIANQGPFSRCLTLRSAVVEELTVGASVNLDIFASCVAVLSCQVFIIADEDHSNPVTGVSRFT